MTSDTTNIPKDVLIDYCKEDKLFDEDPECDHEIIDAPGGGVKCTKCNGWFCL